MAYEVSSRGATRSNEVSRASPGQDAAAGRSRFSSHFLGFERARDLMYLLPVAPGHRDTLLQAGAGIAVSRLPFHDPVRPFFSAPNNLVARGESPAAFGRRCIPPGGVAPRSNTPGILTRRALPKPGAILLPGPSVQRRTFTTDWQRSCASHRRAEPSRVAHLRCIYLSQLKHWRRGPTPAAN